MTRETETTTALSPCPCVATPEKLGITAEHDQPKWAHVSGNCCGAWLVEFRNQYCLTASPESYARAVEAWNEAPIGRRSAKPPEARDRLTALCGDDAPRIELFARERVAGWDAWGLEVGT